MRSGRCRYVVASLFTLLLLSFTPGSAAGAEPVGGPAADVGPEKAAAPAEVAADKQYPAILGRIRQALADDAWLKKDWKSDELQADVDRLVEEVRAASGQKDLDAPVRFAALAPAPIREGGPPVLKGLLVAREVDLAHANKSIVLASGNVTISHATDCVIIAGGAVNVSHCRNSLVVAGHWIQMAFDGDPRAMRAAPGGGPPVPANASVLVASGVINVSHLNGSVCASNAVRLGHTSGATFLGVKALEASHAQAAKEIKDAKLPSAPKPQTNPLAGKLALTQVVEPDGGGKEAMVIARVRGGPEVVIRPGQPIRDGNGQVIAELEGWTLSFVGDRLALFRKGDDFAMFDLRAPADPTARLSAPPAAIR